MNSNKRTCFIGNIAFDATEEELNALFASVGPVSNLRLVHDRESGKRKGYGFVEYTDAESAQSAVRNLNEYDLHGRTLRVNIADQDTRSGGGPPSNAAAASEPAGTSRKRKDLAAPAPMVTTGHANASGAGATEVLLPPSLDPIAAYVERHGRAQLFDFVLQAKHFTAMQPEKAASLLTAHPQLYCALQLAIDRLAGPHWPPPVAVDNAPPPSSAPPPSAPPPSAPPPSAPPPQPPASVAVLPSEPIKPIKQELAEAPQGEGAALMSATAPGPQVKLEQPSTSAPPSLAPPQAAPMDPAMRDQLMQLMQLSPAQLEALPPEQRAQVMALRQTM